MAAPLNSAPTTNVRSSLPCVDTDRAGTEVDDEQRPAKQPEILHEHHELELPSADSIDTPTGIAIAALAYPLANLVHKGLGHGGAVLLLGARPTMFNAILFNHDESTASATAQRLISAAGSVANVLFGARSAGRRCSPGIRRCRDPRRPGRRTRHSQWIGAAHGSGWP